MESQEESIRLDQKTDPLVVEKQARWAGIQPGMRIADLGCGSGKTTQVLYSLAQPGGEAVGLDFAPNRYEFAQSHYTKPGVRFLCRDVRDSLDDLGTFDFIWVRFLLEYYLSSSLKIVQHISKYLKPGGTLCLIDLDHNSLNHYGLSEKLEKSLKDLTALSQEKADFDPWVGRKLYSFFYDLGYEKISVDVSAHHLIYGPLNEMEAFNWVKKSEVGLPKLGYDFPAYQGSFNKFHKEFMEYIRNPRRFIYTPVIACRGIKPVYG
ncbi:MAG: methyltransferase domain-containing protein [Deltaproteobacteria bacterium]|nr:methyltransferase domain-containing protein [Deltaproteobacteria bacterium]